MARVISDSCISCGSCAAQCPVSAISQGDAHYEIDPNTCIDCGSCEAQCPVGAISVVPDHPAKEPPASRPEALLCNQ